MARLTEEITARREAVKLLYIESGSVWAISKVLDVPRHTVRRDIEAMKETQDLDGLRAIRRQEEITEHGEDYLLTLITTQMGHHCRSVHDKTCRKVLKKAS